VEEQNNLRKNMVLHNKAAEGTNFSAFFILKKYKTPQRFAE
jgi:hypothetical protein